MNQCNVVHTLLSVKQVDNQVSMPTDPTQTSTPSSTPPTSQDKSAEQVHKPITLFSNRLRRNNNAQIEKILEIFNQVKIKVPLLVAIQQVPTYVKFLKNMCTKKRKRNVLKKFFLVTNISELLSNQIPIKYKNSGCPTVSCTIGLIDHFLIWERVSTCSLSQYINNLGWAN